MPVMIGGPAENPPDSAEQRTARRCHRESRARGGGGEVRERGDVGETIADFDRQIVAAVLALGADSARHPPHGGVIEQQRLDDRLQQVDEIVVAPHVRELVGDQRFDLRRTQPRERRRRQQHHGFHPADHRRHGHGRRLHDAYRAIEREPAGDTTGD